jgi:hypothetical protein
MRVSIIVTDADETCGRCTLLRLALVCVRLRPGVCLPCCDEVVAVLIDHAGRCHPTPGTRAAAPFRAGYGKEEEHTHMAEPGSPPA